MSVWFYRVYHHSDFAGHLIQDFEVPQSKTCQLISDVTDIPLKIDSSVKIPVHKVTCNNLPFLQLSSLRTTGKILVFVGSSPWLISKLQNFVDVSGRSRKCSNLNSTSISRGSADNGCDMGLISFAKAIFFSMLQLVFWTPHRCD